MTTRRQERMARIIRDAVSDAICGHLSDPRIEALVSVTKVQVAADLHTAEVFISVFGATDGAQKKTFAGIEHARARIQSFVAGRLHSKFCPVLRFHQDESIRKTLETMKLIDQISDELRKKDMMPDGSAPDNAE